VTIPAGGGPSVTELTDPTPVGCRAPAILHPPLVGHGWIAGNGCCTFINSHRGAILPVNGVLKAPEQFAIDYVHRRRSADRKTCRNLSQMVAFNASAVALRVSSVFGSSGANNATAEPALLVHAVDDVRLGKVIGTCWLSANGALGRVYRELDSLNLGPKAARTALHAPKQSLRLAPDIGKGPSQNPFANRSRSTEMSFLG
jgi:hypothetical protein